MIKVLKDVIHSAGAKYCSAVTKSEYESQVFRRINERPIEYRFVFQSILATCPKTALDVGTGTTALPSLIRTCGPVVTAIDNVRDYWTGNMVNRHFYVKDEDVTGEISGPFDFVTCISVLEHIREHEKAVRSMLGALRSGGHLALTFPYNERQYVENVYQLPGAGYGQDVPYVCQVYSRKELDQWFSGGATIVRQEYWRMFSGEFWTFGESLVPPVETTRDELHQLTCLLVKKN